MGLVWLESERAAKTITPSKALDRTDTINRDRVKRFFGKLSKTHTAFQPTADNGSEIRAGNVTVNRKPATGGFALARDNEPYKQRRNEA
jgi:hypothetical protein